MERLMNVPKIHREFVGEFDAATTFEDTGTAFEELIFGRWAVQEISTARKWDEWALGDSWETGDDEY